MCFLVAILFIRPLDKLIPIIPKVKDLKIVSRQNCFSTRDIDINNENLITLQDINKLFEG